MTRQTAPAPVLTGYTVIRHLGGGGFADVYLYDQHKPKRKVAVKVLEVSAATAQMRAQFDDEADLMAAVSSHPSIVTIHEAGVSAGGSPYLVMEYCSRPNLAEQYKAGEISVADVLRIGVQLAGAVESAHRAGIIHRDIKPANVLTTDYNRPALTDFGISVTVGEALNSERVGLSIPWSPPEMCMNPPTGDELADVYSLAATVYTALAGRSPFEVTGRRLTESELVHRILNSPLPPIGRADVPAVVSRVLSKAMHRVPAHRYQTALDFARELQQAQADLGQVVTTVDLVDDEQPAETIASVDDGRTRIRPLITIEAQRPAGPVVDPKWAPSVAESVSPVISEAEVAATRMRVAATPTGDYLRPEFAQAPALPADTQLRTGGAESADVDEPTDPRRKWPVVVAVSVLLVVGAAVALILGIRGTAVDKPSDTTATMSQDTELAVLAAVPPPAELTGVQRGDQFIFTWVNSDPQDGDAFSWRRVDVADDAPWAPVDAMSVALPIEPKVCIQVRQSRANGSYSRPPAQACAEMASQT